MDLHRASSWGRLLAGAGLSLLALLLAAPSSARATCGDYVQSGSRSAHAPEQHRPTPAAPAPCPCSGPHCGRGTPQPLPVPVSRTAVQAKDWLCPPGRFLIADLPSAPLPADQPAACPSGPGLSIYHPPRSHQS